MSANDTANVTTPMPTRWRVAKLAAIWIVGCSFAGVVVAMVNGEFGSIVFAIVGVFVGLSGAISHCVLIRRVSFRRRSDFEKAAILWVAAMVLPGAWAVFGALNSDAPIDRYYLIYFGGGIAVFALVASVCIALFEARWSV
jgi:hypothetical protein